MLRAWKALRNLNSEFFISASLAALNDMKFT